MIEIRFKLSGLLNGLMRQSCAVAPKNRQKCAAITAIIASHSDSTGIIGSDRQPRPEIRTIEYFHERECYFLYSEYAGLSIALK